MQSAAGQANHSVSRRTTVDKTKTASYRILCSFAQFFWWDILSLLTKKAIRVQRILQNKGRWVCVVE